MTPAELDALVDAMTLDEQVAILSGADVWSLPAIERLGITKLRMTDGPNGARGGGSLFGGVAAAAFPVGICIGASWDTKLAEQIGTALAHEVKSKGAHAVLAPTVNMHRTVTNGRNFECYSEDPTLTAALACGVITGLQGQGVAATIKHFVGNESEIERTTINSQVDERTLREVYLRPFEAAVKEAGTWGIMSSYNQLNGTYAAENHWLLTEVLRGDWGYDGIVMSDWFGSRSTAPTVNAGLDLEMPGPTRDRGDKLVAAVQEGAVDAATVRTRALNILRWMDRTGGMRDPGPWVEIADDRAETRALIRRAGAAGTVLLQNDGILPLTGGGTIAVIGPNARTAQVMGGGSAQLNPHYAITPWDGLVSRFGASRLTYAPGCTNHRWEPVLQGPFRVEYFANRTLSGSPVAVEQMAAALAFWMPPIAGGAVDYTAFSARLTTTVTVDRTGTYTLGIHSAGLSRVLVDGILVADAWAGWAKGQTFFEEGCDEVAGTITLTAGQAHQVVIEFATRQFDNLMLSALRAGLSLPMGDAEIAQAVATAKAADSVILCLGRSGEWDTEGSDLLDIRLPGRQDELVAAVCAANPRTVVVLQTGGPVEMPWAGQAAAVLQAWYPGQECGNAIADVLSGNAEPGGRLPQTFPVRWQDNPAHSQDREVYPGLNGKVRYEEGVFIGYRHYDRLGIVPLYPFGHGLSYTTFALSGLMAAPLGDGVRVTATVTNTGARAGSTVAQVYVGEPAAPLPRPHKELKGFVKVTLDPGESRVVTVDLTARDFAWFDVAARGWQVTGGDYRIDMGFSATDLAGSVTIRRPALALAV